jgi:hypothetical protein
MFHDHELVFDHGTPSACPPARSSVITSQTMIYSTLGGGHAEPCQHAQHLSTPSTPSASSRP